MFKWMTFLAQPRVFNAEGGGGGGGEGGGDTVAGGGGDTVAGGAGGGADTLAGGGGDAPAAKWWEDQKTYDPETQKWLAARGLTVDDPLAILPKVIQGHRAAETRIGKGLDSIIDRPAKGQALGDWARANAEALGLPADANGYEVKPPADWPKDLPWDSAAEKAVRDIAFKHGVSPEAHQAYVGFQAAAMKALVADADAGLERAKAEMNADLQKEWGDQTEARKTRAGQAMQVIAEKAGMTVDHIQALAQTMSGASSDASVIRLFDVVAEIIGDDTGFAMGRGNQKFGMTPAEARAELSRFESAEGEFGKAFAAGDQRKMAELKPRREQLSKLAAG